MLNSGVKTLESNSFGNDKFHQVFAYSKAVSLIERAAFFTGPQYYGVNRLLRTKCQRLVEYL